MDIEQFLGKVLKSASIDSGEFMIVSGALWAMLALKNTKPKIFKELVKTYGKGLETLK